MTGGVREVARRTLAEVPMNVGFARAVVDGVVDGDLWSDRPADPRAFHAAHPYGMSLVWGPDVAAAAHDVVRQVRERAARGGRLWLQVEPRWHGLDWDAMLAPGAVRHARVNFAFDAADFAARWSAPARPVGVTVRRATEADYAWPGRVVPHGFWPDAATFLAHGGGRVAEVDGAPAALAFCSFHTGDDVEIGIETVPAFRRRGLAAVASAAMIADVLAEGRTPVWSCRGDNVASARLARSLGFVPSLRLPYFEVLPR